MVMVTYYNIYYCVIVAWSLYYFIASFVAIPDLPWNTCGELYFRTYVGTYVFRTQAWNVAISNNS